MYLIKVDTHLISGGISDWLLGRKHVVSIDDVSPSSVDGIQAGPHATDMLATNNKGTSHVATVKKILYVLMMPQSN